MSLETALESLAKAIDNHAAAIREAGAASSPTRPVAGTSAPAGVAAAAPASAVGPAGAKAPGAGKKTPAAGAVPAPGSAGKPAGQAVPGQHAQVPAPQTPAAQVAAAPGAAQAPAIKYDVVREAVLKLGELKGHAQAVAVLAKFGVKSAKELDAARYAEVIAAATEAAGLGTPGAALA